MLRSSILPACGFAVLALIFPLASRAQSVPVLPPPVSPTVLPQDMLDHWRRATVSLGQVIEDGGVKRFVTLGSGVIVAVDAYRGCLLTAKHMVFNPDEGYLPTQLYMRLPKSEPSSETDFGVVLPLIVNGRNVWNTTSTPSDLAVVPLPDLSKYKTLHAVFLKDFGTADDIYQGASVLILGYPGILGEAYQTSPIIRGGVVAWTDPDDPTLKPFLVDANIFGGNSGGPVFHQRSGFDRHGGMVLGGGIAFVGIVSQDAKEFSDVIVTDNATFASKLNLPNKLSGKPDEVKAVVKNIGGIGVVETAARARQLVEDVFKIPHNMN
jgi:hypothetical protein